MLEIPLVRTTIKANIDVVKIAIATSVSTKVNPELFLFDADSKSTDIKYGFLDKPSVYNSLYATDKMMRVNNVKNYFIMNTKNRFPLIFNLDIIISTLSYGYHYPVETYLEKINQILSKNGVLIIDIRENTDGIKKVGKIFPYIDIISNYNKSARICARRI